MKKLLGILLIVIFTFSLYFSVSNDIATKPDNSSGYASVIPIPPSVPQAKTGT